MPPIDPSIIMGIRPVQIQQRDPLESYGKSLALKGLLRRGELEEVQAEQARMGLDDSRRVRSVYDQAAGDNARLRALLPSAGPAGYKALHELEKAELEAEAKRAGIGKDKAAAGKSEYDTKIGQIQHISSVLAEVQKNPAMYGSAKRMLAATFGPQMVADAPEEYDPSYIASKIALGQTLAQRLTDERAREQQAETGRHNRATEGNTVRGQNLTAQVAREGHGVTVRGQNLTDTRARELAQATRDAAATGRIPPGYRQTANGDLEAIPGGPADKVNTKGVETQRTLDAYVAARDGLMSGLDKTWTGALSGRMPAMSTGQQIAEGGVAAMAPVLKQLFRSAGEGVFTDRDQQLLLDMVPKRTDTPEAAAEKMANIDRIVAAKLGVQVPARAKKPEGTWAVVK